MRGTGEGGRLGRDLFPDAVWRAAAEALGLSPRELDVAQGLFDRLDEEAIGDELGLSKHTVHVHVKKLYQKLSVSRRWEMVLELVEILVTYADDRAT